MRRADPLHQMLFLMSSLALPILLADRAASSGLAPQPLAASLRRLARDRDAIEQRLDWALGGLEKEGAHASRR